MRSHALGRQKQELILAINRQESHHMREHPAAVSVADVKILALFSTQLTLEWNSDAISEATA